MTVVIDLPKARQLLKDAVETQGRDFVYNFNGRGYCRYIPNYGDVTRPEKAITGCLIGTALKLAGLPENSIDRQGTIISLANYLRYDRVALIQDGAAYYFKEAQTVQDAGGSWGEAYDAAERLYHKELAS